MIKLKDVHIGYGGKKETVLNSLSLEVSEPGLVCLLGPNGVGKSTLLRTLAGIQLPLQGKIYINHHRLQNLTALQLARMVSTVTTNYRKPGYLTAEAVVAMGRSPHTNWLGRLTPKDRKMIWEAFRLTQTEQLAGKPFTQLSDGQRQRVMIARALAQDTPLILMDEPTAFLDLPNRIALMQLLRKLARETGKLIIMATHDLALALNYGDWFWVIPELHAFSEGLPEDLLLNGLIERVFFSPAHDPLQRRPDLHLSVNLTGDQPASYWTARALKKAGWRVEGQNEKTITIWVSQRSNTPSWCMEGKSYTSISDLLNALEKAEATSKNVELYEK